MFDGITELALPSSDPRSLVALYRDLMGFVEVDTDDAPDALYGALYGLPAAPVRTILLAKPGSSGGAIRILDVPMLPAASPAGRPDRNGPYALDFYLADPGPVEHAIVNQGWDFVTEPVHYDLPGTSIPVRERMLRQDESGLLHAFVQYRPRGTRCVIDQHPDTKVSEVVAAVFMTADLAGARDFATTVLGGAEYFTGRFDGPAVEQMLALSPGEGFEAALFRGPTSANARLEFAQTIPGGTLAPDPIPRVVAVCDLPDLDVVAAALADGKHGTVSADVVVDGRRQLGLASRYGAHFVLRQSAS
ncbi:hypothetical protein ACLM5J_00620 [Nocardioides sp. Bht2]|uniref:hypothetical protein n=1 Tax=Nocardioides sp. Bht2 TaxID=3392297 RepID=UPI0039B4DF35